MDDEEEEPREEIPFIGLDEVDPDTMVSYPEAALILGTTHNRVRILTHEGRIHAVARVWIRPNVSKVYVSKADVEAYREAHKVVYTKRVKLTEDEWKQFKEIFGKDSIK